MRAIKNLLAILILVASVIGSKVSIPEVVSGGAARARKECAGKVAEITCASSYPMETCLPSSTVVYTEDIKQQRYTTGAGDNNCSEKNPMKHCEGAAVAPSADCNIPIGP